MARFNYIARNSAGQRESGVEDGSSARAVSAKLRKRGFTPVSVELAKETAAGTKLRQRGGHATLLDVATFVRQLSAMLGAGVELVLALEDLAVQEEKASFANVLQQVRSRVVGGIALSAALKEHRKVFSNLLCTMVRAGEETGRLDEVLADLAKYLEGQVALRRKLRSALTYPAAVMVIFSGAVAFLFLFLLPKFRDIFGGMGAKLPLISRVALGFSAALQQWWFLLVGALILLALGYKICAATEKGRCLLDSLKLKIPIMGNVLRKIMLVRFLETLGTMQSSGVPIHMSLAVARETIGNRTLEEEIGRARDKVIQGAQLSHELAKSPLFPRMMVRMMAVGEETGRSEQLLKHAANFYKAEADAQIEDMTTLIEPIVIVMMGLVVGFVVLAIYLPIFSMGKAMS
jgi:type IV pilus assembly protein PilC